MPNFEEHDYMGNAVGLLYGLYGFLENPSLHGTAESIGRFVGSKIGMHLPDKIDIPTSPNHRSTAHSYLVIGAGVYSVPKLLAEVSQVCREKAQHHEQMAMNTNDMLICIYHKVAALFWSFLNGLLAGLPVGYFTHLLQDLFTPKSLPAY